MHNLGLETKNSVSFFYYIFFHMRRTFFYAGEFDTDVDFTHWRLEFKLFFLILPSSLIFLVTALICEHFYLDEIRIAYLIRINVTNMIYFLEISRRKKMESQTQRPREKESEKEWTAWAAKWMTVLCRALIYYLIAANHCNAVYTVSFTINACVERGRWGRWLWNGFGRDDNVC